MRSWRLQGQRAECSRSSSSDPLHGFQVGHFLCPAMVTSLCLSKSAVPSPTSFNGNGPRFSLWRGKALPPSYVPNPCFSEIMDCCVCDPGRTETQGPLASTSRAQCAGVTGAHDQTQSKSLLIKTAHRIGVPSSVFCKVSASPNSVSFSVSRD